MKNNYYLNSQDLSFQLPQKLANLKLSIKLNYLEYLKIKYHKKETVYYEINLKKEWLKFALFALPSMFVGWLAKGCYEDRTFISAESYNQRIQNEKSEKVIEMDTLIEK